MIERLYYKDSFLREFDASVLSCERDGSRWKITLDRTAFYPTSGGQPYDLGKLGSVPVIEVAEGVSGAENETIVHYTPAPVSLGPIHAEIDWPRRFDHMQQHTGQHLLSAVFIQLFKFPTISFHLGKEVSTIDLAAPSIVSRHLEEAERRANEIIFEDRPVSVSFGTAEELAAAGIRKQVEREGVLRAIEIEGVDRQPCGGTHVARTGQAGLLLIRRLERRRDAWRLEFLCGFRALAAARRDFQTLAHAASLLSCGLPDVTAALARMIEERRTQHRTVKQLEERLASHEARALLEENPPHGPGSPRIVTAALAGATPTYLALLASKLAAEPGVVTLLASSSSGHVVFSQTKGLLSDRDLGAVLRLACQEFEGKGGGVKDHAQGCLANASMVTAFLVRARELLG
jgi:alanyl-tRNA synthetase